MLETRAPKWRRYYLPDFSTLPPEAEAEYRTNLPKRKRNEKYDLPPRCTDMLLNLAWAYRDKSKGSQAKPPRPPKVRPSDVGERMKAKKLPPTPEEAKAEIRQRFETAKAQPPAPPFVTEVDSLKEPKPQFTPEQIKERFSR